MRRMARSTPTSSRASTSSLAHLSSSLASRFTASCSCRTCVAWSLTKPTCASPSLPSPRRCRLCKPATHAWEARGKRAEEEGVDGRGKQGEAETTARGGRDEQGRGGRRERGEAKRRRESTKEARSERDGDPQQGERSSRLQSSLRKAFSSPLPHSFPSPRTPHPLHRRHPAQIPPSTPAMCPPRIV